MATVYKWERYAMSYQVSITDGLYLVIDLSDFSGSFFVGDTLLPTTDGNIEIANATQVTCSYSYGTSQFCTWITTFAQTYEGKWLTKTEKAAKAYYLNGYVYENGYYSEIGYAKVAEAQLTKGDYVDTVESENTSAYPENGELNGYWYVYAGSEKAFDGGVFATIDGVQCKLTSIPAMVDGVLREMSSLFATVDGVAREIFRKAASSILPDGYTQLEYIESTGTQYIDTGFAPNQDTRIDIDFYFLESNTGNDHHIASVNNSAQYYAFRAKADLTGYAVRYYTGSLQDVSASSLYGRHKVVRNKNVVSLDDGTAITSTHGTFQIANTLPLCCYKAAASGVVSGFASLRIYSCQIYDNGTPVRDFVPCTNHNGEVGLYDLISGEFYGNAGSGEFIAGAASSDGSDSSVISFTINGVSYEAESGMTWSEWINSDYNTGGFKSMSGSSYVWASNGDDVVYNPNTSSDYEILSNVIDPTVAYRTAH